MKKTGIASLSGLMLALSLSHHAAAQTYPTKPVHVIVAITTASVTDIAVRTIGQEMRNLTGQPWLVENRPGGNMFLATQACVQAAPDGYTLCATNSGPVSYNPHIFSQKPYDIEKDLIPVTNMYFVLSGVIVRKDIPVNSVAELKALAAKGTQLNFGTLGPGSIPDVFRQWLNREWNANFADIAYKGGGEVAQALIKGEIDAAYIGLGNMTTQLQDGQLRALAVEGPHRSKYLPNVPTFDEAGIGNYPFGGPIWWGIHCRREHRRRSSTRSAPTSVRPCGHRRWSTSWSDSSSSRRPAPRSNSPNSPRMIATAPARSSPGSTCPSNSKSRNSQVTRRK